MDLTVYIPTRGRTGLDKQITVREFKKHQLSPPIIVCHDREVSRHQWDNLQVMVCNLDGIGPTRQFIIENCPTRGVVMFDDDLYFTMRETPDAPRPLVQIPTSELHPMLNWISDQLDAGYAHGGISARQGNQHIPYPWTDCIRVNNAHFFDRDIYLNEGIRFDRIPVMEDFDVTLQLLTKGYPNRVAYHYCWSQRGSGTKGGCSLYRTKELQAAAAQQLQAYWPEYVKIVTKTAISGGELFAGDRTDVNIQWIKAWENRVPASRTVPTPFLKRR
jgi:hypothetical protein